MILEFLPELLRILPTAFLRAEDGKKRSPHSPWRHVRSDGGDLPSIRKSCLAALELPFLAATVTFLYSIAVQ